MSACDWKSEAEWDRKKRGRDRQEREMAICLRGKANAVLGFCRNTGLFCCRLALQPLPLTLISPYYLPGSPGCFNICHYLPGFYDCASSPYICPVFVWLVCLNLLYNSPSLLDGRNKSDFGSLLYLRLFFSSVPELLSLGECVRQFGVNTLIVSASERSAPHLCFIGNGVATGPSSQKEVIY